MTAHQQRAAPHAGERLRGKEHRIRAATRRAVHERLANRLVARASRDQIHNAGECPRTVQGGGDALDHFDLTEIGGRNLQQAKAADRFAEERQAVGKEPRMSSAHPLNTHARRPERWRRRLHAQAAHLVQHHDDVAGRHELLLFNLLAIEHFDTHRLIFETLVGSRGGHGDAFFDGRRLFELDRHRLLLAGRHGDGRRHRRESLLDDRQVDRPRGDVNPYFAAGVRHVRPAADANFCARDGCAAGRDCAGYGRLTGLE